MVDFSLTNLVVLSGSLQIRFSGLEGVSGVIRCLSHFGSPIEEKVSDLGGLEGLESLEMHGFSGLEGVSGVIRRNKHFGGPIEKKVSDLGGLEGLEMHGFRKARWKL